MASDIDTGAEIGCPGFKLDETYLLFILIVSLCLQWVRLEEVIFSTSESFRPRLTGATVHSPRGTSRVWLPARKLLMQSHRQFNRNCNLKQKTSIYHQLVILLNMDLFSPHTLLPLSSLLTQVSVSSAWQVSLRSFCLKSLEHERLFSSLDYLSQNHI